MKKKTKILISTICALVMCFGIVGGVSAAVNVNSSGIIRFTGEDGQENTTDDIVFDASDITTLANEVDAEKQKVVADKKGLAEAINSATASSSVPTNFETTEANLPAFNDLKNAIANVKAAGNEEGIITGQNNVINNVGGNTSATLGNDGTLTLKYGDATGASSITNPTWAAIQTQLAGKTDTNGEIYSGVNSVDSLVQAIGRDNDNSYEQGQDESVLYLTDIVIPNYNTNRPSVITLNDIHKDPYMVCLSAYKNMTGAYASTQGMGIISPNKSGFMNKSEGTYLSFEKSYDTSTKILTLTIDSDSRSLPNRYAGTYECILYFN